MADQARIMETVALALAAIRVMVVFRELSLHLILILQDLVAEAEAVVALEALTHIMEDLAAA